MNQHQEYSQQAGQLYAYFKSLSDIRNIWDSCGLFPFSLSLFPLTICQSELTTTALNNRLQEMGVPLV